MKGNFAAALATGVCIVALATPAQAQQREFNIPAGNLKAALDAYGRQSGRPIIYKADQVRNARTSGYRGSASPQEALDAILANTGFIARADNSGAVAIVRGGNGTANADRVSSLENTSSESNQDIVVTGTNIRGQGPVGTSLRSVTRSEIERSGYQTTQEVIQSLPQNFRGGAAGASADALFSAGASQGYNTSFGSGINLRGLGSTATLVLVNGHRVASSGGGFFTDISSIPVSAIKRIDVLTDGASAIYGSDAVAGVVNFILNDDFDGVETGARFGSATSGGYQNFGANALVGQTWATGNVSLGVDWSKESELDVKDRSFTSGIASPTSIYPSSNQIALLFNGDQRLGDLRFRADGQFSRSRRVSYYTATASPYRAIPKTERWSGSAGVDYDLSSRWSMHYTFSEGFEKNDSTIFLISGRAPTEFYTDTTTRSRFEEHNFTINGQFLQLPAGPIRLAAGATHRDEHFSNTIESSSGTTFDPVGRNITGVFGELTLPIFSAENDAPGLRALTLSAAVRRDRYSDFGWTTNPKFGVSWYPIRSLQIRGAYSTSFRAPSTGSELFYSSQGIVAGVIASFPNATQTGYVPVLYIVGGKPNLQPERANNLTVGFDFKPALVTGLSLSFNYYRIHYKGQLAAPTFSIYALSDPSLAPAITTYANNSGVQALVAAARAGGAQIIDITGGKFGSDPLSQTLYVYDLRTQNLSTTRTEGFDITLNYVHDFTGSTLDSRIDISRISFFDTALTDTSPVVDRSNTVGYPARFRLRAQSTWSRGGFSVTPAFNFVGSYKDTTATVSRNVNAYTTVDLNLRYEFSKQEGPLAGTAVSFSLINAFDQAPPFVANGLTGAASLSDFHYDPANASPLGRMASVTIRKKW